MTKLADGVYAGIVSPDGDAVSNSGVVVFENSILVFDTHFTPEAGAALLAAIRSVSSKPVRYVVNSHWHADHTHGNQAFANATLISSVNARRDMLELDLPSLNRTIRITQTQIDKARQGTVKDADAAEMKRIREQIKAREDYLQTMSRLKIMSPAITLEDSMRIREGNQEVCIQFLGSGHTDGDVILFLPASKIVFAGDLFFNNAIPNIQDANISEWMKTLAGLLKLDAEIFVPGHGPVGSKKEVEAFLRYFEDLKSMIQPAVERGDSLEQTTREIQIPAKYSSYQFQNLFPSNVQKLFAELKALQLATQTPGDSSKTEPRRSPK